MKQRVRANHGSPGVDGVSIEAVEKSEGGMDGFLKAIQRSLKDKSYRDVDSYTLRRLCTHLGRRSQRAYRRPAGVTWWAHLQRLGWTPLQKRPVKDKA